MRPLTVILLIVLIAGLSFFGFTIYKTKKQATSTGTTAITTSNKQNFKLKVGSKSVWVNNVESIMDTPVREINGRTMVPVKFLLDFLKAQNVNYDAKTEEVTFDLELPTDTVAKLDANPQQSETILDTLLTQENKDKITSTASMSATFFKINKIESDGNTVSIWIDLLMEPKTNEDVRKISDTFANDVSYIFDTKHDINVIAIRTEPGKDSYKKFGTSQFKASTGKIEFSEEK